MRPLSDLRAADVERLVGVVFDLDDTLLDHGALTEVAYRSLFRLREAGLTLIACTGRPAGWGEILQRQWPLDATVVENGSLALVSQPSAVGAARVITLDPVAPSERRGRRALLLELAEEIVTLYPGVGLADDNAARLTDVTLDIGEHCSVDPETIAAIRWFARSRGVRTLVSSVHLHLTFETDDKATGTVRLLVDRFGEDPTRARSRYAFVGDSANDAAAFAAFRLTCGVANVVAQVRGLTVLPRYLAPAPMGRGFAAFADRLLELRAPA